MYYFCLGSVPKVFSKQKLQNILFFNPRDERKGKLTCKHLSGHHGMFPTTKISKLLVLTIHVFQAFHTSFSAVE